MRCLTHHGASGCTAGRAILERLKFLHRWGMAQSQYDSAAGWTQHHNRWDMEAGVSTACERPFHRQLPEDREIVIDAGCMRTLLVPLVHLALHPDQWLSSCHGVL